MHKLEMATWASTELFVEGANIFPIGSTTLPQMIFLFVYVCNLPFLNVIESIYFRMQCTPCQAIVEQEVHIVATMLLLCASACFEKNILCTVI